MAKELSYDLRKLGEVLPDLTWTEMNGICKGLSDAVADLIMEETGTAVREFIPPEYFAELLLGMAKDIRNTHEAWEAERKEAQRA